MPLLEYRRATLRERFRGIPGLEGQRPMGPVSTAVAMILAPPMIVAAAMVAGFMACLLLPFALLGWIRKRL